MGTPRGLGGVAAALDAAIADVAAATFDRLTNGLSDAEKARRVSHALDSLHGSIRQLEMPEYDEDLVALFYSVWYQPFQINSAYSLLYRAIEQRQSRLALKRGLDVVDFGSGALAMELGLALAVFDTQAQRLTIPEINIYLLEPSEAMTRIGLDIWGCFLKATGDDVSVDLGSWCSTAHFGRSSINVKRTDDPSNLAGRPESDRWLVAMHAYYGKHRDAIKRDLMQIHEAFQPELGLFTCHHGSLGGIDYVSPFAGTASPTHVPPLRMSGELPRVNRWRRRLSGELGLQKDLRLTRPTEWDPERGLRDNRAVFFVRQSP